MFRYNGFTITILKDKVLVTQGQLKFEFNTVEDALAALGKC